MAFERVRVRLFGRVRAFGVLGLGLRERLGLALVFLLPPL